MAGNAPPDEKPTVSIQAKLATPGVRVKIVTLDCPAALEAERAASDTYRFDLCLDPRPVGAWLNFADHWPRHRRELPGSLFFVPPGQAVRFNSGVGRQRAIICRMAPKPFQRGMAEDFATRNRQIEGIIDVVDPVIPGLIRRMAAEARAPDFGSEILLEAFGVQLAVELERYLGGRLSEIGTGGLAAWRLNLIDERLDDIASPPTLAELAALCRISVRQLARGFRASRQNSIGGHIAAKRLENAKGLLAQGQTVARVASAVGFTSSSSFCSAFRKRTGLSPREYQIRRG